MTYYVLYVRYLLAFYIHSSSKYDCQGWRILILNKRKFDPEFNFHKNHVTDMGVAVFELQFCQTPRFMVSHLTSSTTGYIPRLIFIFAFGCKLAHGVFVLQPKTNACVCFGFKPVLVGSTPAYYGWYYVLRRGKCSETN